jgi:hypothetical protein
MDPVRLTALKLAKEGFGTPEQIEQMPTDIVLDAIEYVTFLGDYETTAAELNKTEK